MIHPTLKETGVSYIKLHDFHNLTIFSKNGATIKHAGVLVEGSSTNIIIRNLAFDELWEWDENTNGDYDRNDWDYMTIEDNAEGIWVDHCTFYKAYDGIIDMKKGKDFQRVTISWCEFLPGSKDDTFFNEQMTWLENNMDSTTYYKSLRTTQGLSAEQVRAYAHGQKKTHLFGSDDGDVVDRAIRATLANNYYKNSMDRMPRLRYGKVHEYNCILDAQDLYDTKKSGNSWLSSHITSNGAISTCGGEMLLENCYISGIEHPLASGNGSSPTGAINAVNSLYYLNGESKELKPEKNGSGSGTVLTTDAAKFIEALPYQNYTKYDASKLGEIVKPFAGAGKLTMTTVQWERTSYNGEEGGDVSGTGTEGSGTDESGDSEESSNTEESSSTETSSSPGTSESGIRIVGLKESYLYTGDKITPVFDVYDYDIPGGKLLVLGVDYTVTYKNNKEPGTATIIVKGKGNYVAAKGKGNEATATFEIKEVEDATTLANIKGAKINKIDDMDYNGKPRNPSTITLTLKDRTEVSYEYNETTGKYEKAGSTAMDVNIAVSNNVNKGTATVLVSGVDDKGKPVKIKGKFKIKPLKIDTTVTAEAADYAVNGAAPSSLKVTAMVGGKTEELKSGRDYTVKYANNKKAGRATVTVTGKGNYTGKATGTYEIKTAKLSGYRVAAVTACDGMKSAKMKATVVDENGNALKASQYTLTIYKAAENGTLDSTKTYEPAETLEAGVIYVQAVAKDTNNLEGQTDLNDSAKFYIGIDISKAKVSAPDGKGVTKEYKGIPIELTGDDLKVTLKGVEGDLEIGTDYEIAAHSNNTSKGTATVVLKGIGDYSGTKTFKFKITQKTVSGEIKRLEEVNKAVINLLKSLAK